MRPPATRASSRGFPPPAFGCRSSFFYFIIAAQAGRDKEGGGNIDNIAVIGGGPVGGIFSAYLARSRKRVFLLDIRDDIIEAVRERGLTVDGKDGSFTVPLSGASRELSELRRFEPRIIAVAVKSCHLDALLEEVAPIFKPGQKILVLQNGVDNEKRVAERLGPDSVLRAVINYAGMVRKPGLVQMTFFNPPNYIGTLHPDNEPLARDIAALMTDAGLETVFTTEIVKYEWIKTILSAGLMPVCALTGLDMKEAFEIDETRFLCERILQESIRVVEALGFDLGNRFLSEGLDYLSRAGHHRPSLSIDLERGNALEYVFQHIIDEGKKTGVPTPYLESLTMIIRTLERERRKKKNPG